MAELRSALSFVLANYTGDGFSGDLGYKSAAFLAADVEHDEADVRAELDAMVADGEATERAGEYAKAPYKGAMPTLRGRSLHLRNRHLEIARRTPFGYGEQSFGSLRSVKNAGMRVPGSPEPQIPCKR